MAGPLALRTPQTALEVIEAWADFPADVRKRRAAEASQQDDRLALRSLQAAYIGLHGRRGTDTSPRTVDTYWRGAQLFLDWCGRSGVKPHQVGDGEARRFLASLADTSAKSRQVYLTGSRSLVAALRWAGLGSGDPFTNVRVIDPTPSEENADPYTVAELQRLLAASDTRERVLTLLAADGGLRLAEVASLTWAGVDLHRKQLTVEGKGGKRAKVAATDRLVKALKALHQESGPVLGVSRRRVQQLFDRLCERAAVKPRGYHALRHSCGTRLYRTTKDLLVVQRHLRHSSARTSEIYAHLSAVDYQRAIASLERIGAGE